MFDFLKRTSGTQVDKLIKRLTETAGEDGPRIEAAEKLDELDTPEATYALLKRFTISSKVISSEDASPGGMAGPRANEDPASGGVGAAAGRYSGECGAESIHVAGASNEFDQSHARSHHSGDCRDAAQIARRR